MNLGILVPNLGNHQLAYQAIKEVNRISSENVNDDVVIFYEDLAKPCLPCNFAITNILDAWNYKGVVIATTIRTAAKLIKFPGAKKKYFYVYDLEWIEGLASYEMMAEIYQNKNLNLLSRSEEYAKYIQAAWNIDVKNILEDFNMSKLLMGEK